MNVETLKLYSILKWKTLTEENKKYLISANPDIIIGTTNEGDVKSMVSQVFKCGRKKAKEYAEVLQAIGISKAKIRSFLGK